MREKNFVINPISKKNKNEFNLVMKKWMEKLDKRNEPALAINSGGAKTKSHS